MQSPSVYSAIKIEGKRLCDIAREGGLSLEELQKIADSRAKNIEIFSFEIMEKIDDDCFRFIINHINPYRSIIDPYTPMRTHCKPNL